MGKCKTINFLKAYVLENSKTNVSISPDIAMAAILDIQNGRRVTIRMPQFWDYYTYHQAKEDGFVKKTWRNYFRLSISLVEAIKQNITVNKLCEKY